MRALLVYCHPSPASFTAAVRGVVERELSAAGAAVHVIDLYGEGFSPVMGRGEWDGYLATPENEGPVATHVAALRWADAVVFVYPTWWYGPPAMLKGWLDRVLLPGVAFELQSSRDISPSLTHVRTMAVFTTCGASRWLTYMIGDIGKRMLLRGVRPLCHLRTQTSFLAHYSMDDSTPESRAAHLEAAAARARRLVARHRPSPAPDGLPHPAAAE